MNILIEDSRPHHKWAILCHVLCFFLYPFPFASWSECCIIDNKKFFENQKEKHYSWSHTCFIFVLWSCFACDEAFHLNLDGQKYATCHTRRYQTLTRPVLGFNHLSPGRGKDKLLSSLMTYALTEIWQIRQIWYYVTLNVSCS